MDRPVIVLEDETFEIPGGIVDLAAFREWLRSPAFPESGRIDWLQGRMEVEMAPEDLETHGGPKSTIATSLARLIQEPKLGRVYIDRGRLTCPGADLSAEPDVLVLLVETLRSGRARLALRASGVPGRYLEVEGAADLVVECVSDGSVRKDTQRLRDLYHKAGVREYWIVDARREPLRFDVLLHRPEGYAESSAGPDGFRRSEVLAADVRLVQDSEAAGLTFYRMDVK